jgi:hypothetical protein
MDSSTRFFTATVKRIFAHISPVWSGFITLAMNKALPVGNDYSFKSSTANECHKYSSHRLEILSNVLSSQQRARRALTISIVDLREVILTTRQLANRNKPKKYFAMVILPSVRLLHLPC